MDAKQVPLRELLASVPEDARLLIDDADGMGSTSIPVGRLCQEAAAALAEPVQEPQCNPHPKAPHGFLRNASHNEHRYVCECEGWEPYEAGYQAGMEAALAEPVQEPVQEPVADSPDPYHLSRILHELAGSASMCWEHVDRAGVFQSTQAAEFVAAAIDEIRQRMELAPPQRKPLTDEEIEDFYFNNFSIGELKAFARAIERAHGIGGQE